MFLMALLRRASSDINLLSMISSSGAKLPDRLRLNGKLVEMKSTEDFATSFLALLSVNYTLGKDRSALR